MLEDIIQIRPQTKKSYYTGRLEFATPVVNPRQKAQHYFQWGMIYHAKGKPAEAYKYYEKAILFNKQPLYLKQMGILHHEMGYYKDAMKYISTAFELEKELEARLAAKQKSKEEEAFTSTGEVHYSYSTDNTGYTVNFYGKNSSNITLS